MKRGRKPRPKQPPQNPLTCKICNKVFFVYNYEKEKRIYCSLECRYKSRQQPEVALKCSLCDKEFHVEKSYAKRKQYCSERCYKLIYNARRNKEVGKNARIPRGIQNKINQAEIVPESELDDMTFHTENYFTDRETFFNRYRKTT